MESSTKEKIKREAFVLFAREGFEAASMNGIAARVGISKPAIYAHFEGKEALVLAILDDVRRDYCRYMEDAFGEAEKMQLTQKVLHHLFKRYVAYFTDNQLVSSFWVRIIFFPPSSLRSKLSTHMESIEAGYLARLGRIFAEGMERGEVRRGSPEDMALAFYAMREGCLMTAAHNLAGSGLEGIWRNYWQGFAAAGPCSGPPGV